MNNSIKLCTLCGKYPRTNQGCICQRCINKKRRHRYATDEDFRNRDKKRCAAYQHRKIRDDPLYKKQKRETDTQWRKTKPARYVYLQARSAFNRLSPHYRKKLIEELNLSYRKP